MLSAAIRPYFVAGGLAVLLVTHATLYLKGRADGAAVAEAKAIQSTIDQLKERGLINEAVRDTDAVALCIELGGLPDECNQ